MERFKARIYRGDSIELSSPEDLDSLYTVIDNEEDFIMMWTDEKGIKHSEVIITTNISSKVKTGELKLTAIGGNKK